ncbi:Uncharacterized protein Rs2_16443 [Raphanus sativus]|nr:Uncharacterized protein Rs2_16443 [Raphanus sativus]
MENRFASEEFTELQKLALAHGFIYGEAEAYVKRRDKFHKEDSGCDCEPMETASPPSLQSETPALVVMVNCTDQPQVSISVLEPGRRQILLGDIERDMAIKDQQVVKEVVYPVSVDLESEVPEFCEQSSGGKSTSTAYQVFDKMLSRSHKLQRLKKIRLFPKSWKFKFKQQKQQHPHIDKRYLEMMVRSRTIKYKDGKNDSWYLSLGQWKTKRWLRVVGLLSSKKKKTSLLNWKELLAGYKKNLSYKDTWEHNTGCFYDLAGDFVADPHPGRIKLCTILGVSCNDGEDCFGSRACFTGCNSFKLAT